MGIAPADRTGRRYGKLTVVKNPPLGHGSADPKFQCQCDCGSMKMISRSNLRKAKSCGCSSFDYYLSLKERLEALCIPEPNSGCWLWTGSLTHYNDGPSSYGAYGTISNKGRSLKAHRASHTVFVGPIPEGKEVCHSCDNPYCVNPDHLFLGTHLENMKDRDRKGRRKAPKGMAIGTSFLTDDDIRAIRNAIGTQKEIGERFGTDQTNVSLIRRRKSWAHIA